MRTNNYNDSSNRGSRYPKRQGGGSNSGRRPPNRRGPGQHGGASVNVSSISSTRNKYLDLAKEALSNGNRVEAENYFQHAEHYSKLLTTLSATRRERGDDSHDGGAQRRNNYNSERNENSTQ